jgi:hypothetical protein
MKLVLQVLKKPVSGFRGCYGSIAAMMPIVTGRGKARLPPALLNLTGWSRNVAAGSQPCTLKDSVECGLSFEARAVCGVCPRYPGSS